MPIRSYSRFREFGMCPRKAQLSRKYDPKVTAAALAEGDVFHLCLGKMYAQGNVNAGWDLFQHTRDEYLQQARDGGAKPEALERLEQKFSNLDAMLRNYGTYVFSQDIQRYEILAVEEEFLIDLGQGVMLRGFVDGVWKDRKSGVRFIVEHKYKTSHDDELMPLDLQVSLYTLALLPKYGHLPTLYNVALKPANRRGKKESAQEFTKRVTDLVDAEGKSFRWTPGEFESKYFLRRTYSRGRGELQAALTQVRAMDKVMAMVEADPSMAWRNVGDHCKYMCPFKPICIEEDPLLVEQFYDEKHEARKDAAKDAPRPI